MNLLRSAGIPLLAILILLVLLLAAVVLFYDQIGLFLPFASGSYAEATETVASLPDIVDCAFYNKIKSYWRIII